MPLGLLLLFLACAIDEFLRDLAAWRARVLGWHDD
jgi:hypothetical protein